MFPHQKHVWFISCVFYKPCPICAFLMYCSCIAHSHLMHTPLLPLPCLGLYIVSSSLACHVYFMLCSIDFLSCFVFCLSFIFSFILYPHALLSLFISSFLSLILLDPFVYSCPYTKESIGLMHIRRGRNSIGEMHIPRERRHIL